MHSTASRRSSSTPRAVAPELLALAADRGAAREPSRYRGARNKETEDAAVASGPDWVAVRPSVFATNTLGL